MLAVPRVLRNAEGGRSPWLQESQLHDRSAPFLLQTLIPATSHAGQCLSLLAWLWGKESTRLCLACKHRNFVHVTPSPLIPCKCHFNPNLRSAAPGTSQCTVRPSNGCDCRSADGRRAMELEACPQSSWGSNVLLDAGHLITPLGRYALDRRVLLLLVRATAVDTTV